MSRRMRVHHDALAQSTTLNCVLTCFSLPSRLRSIGKRPESAARRLTITPHRMQRAVELREEKLPAGAVRESVRAAQPVSAGYQAERREERRETPVQLVQPERRYAEGERGGREEEHFERERRTPGGVAGAGAGYEGAGARERERTVGERLAGEAPRERATVGERYEPGERYEKGAEEQRGAAYEQRGIEQRGEEQRGVAGVAGVAVLPARVEEPRGGLERERVGGEHIAVRETPPTEFARGAAIGAQPGMERERGYEQREGAGVISGVAGREREGAIRPGAAKVTYKTGHEGERFEGEGRREGVSYETREEEEEPHRHKGMLGKMSERMGEAAHKVGAKLRGEE
jgi:hypothetical protein